MTFSPDICVDHLSRIQDHVELFFDEVEAESRQRQQLIKQNIDDLLDEGDQLKHLLRVDIDLKPHPDTPLHDAQREITREIENLRQELEKRVQRIDNYLNEQRLLCDQMAEPFRPLPKEPLPTEGEMKEFRAYLDRMHEEKARRVEFLTAAQSQVQKYYSLMGILPETDEQQELTYGSIQPTAMNVAKIKMLESKMSSQFDDFKADMDNMRVKLVKLWDFLQVSKSEQARYDRYTEYNSVNHLILYEELQRCEDIKRENMQAYIDKLRKEILIFWDLCYKSPEERNRFVHFNTDVYTEDQLELHEMELTDLKNFYSDNEPIFKAFEDRAALWEKMKELDAKANDPGRFANRGGQLLKEEKERKALNSRLPKIETQLINLCHVYQESHGKIFTINGKSVEEIIAEDHERRAEEKNAARKHPQATGTPLGSSRMISMRTPTTSGVKNSSCRPLTASANKTNRMLPPSSQKSVATGTKRRLSPTRITPAAKRNLLSQIDTTGTKSISRKGFVSPAVRRHSLKRQSIKKRKISLGKRRRENIPPKQSESDTTPTSESISYDVFENLVHSKGLRSSMQPKSPATPCGKPEISVTPATPRTPGSARKKLTTTNKNFQMMI